MGTLSRKHVVIVGLTALAVALLAAIVALLFTSGGGSGSVRNLTVQPADLPPQFAITVEKLYSRKELLAERSADAQTAKDLLGELYWDHQATEEGLKEAIHLTYESDEDIPVVDVWVYTYDDEAAAEAAHAFARATDMERLSSLGLGNGMRGYLMPLTSALEPEGMGDDAALMEGAIDHYDDGDEMTVGDSLTVQAYFIRSGSARAEVRVAGDSLLVQPEGVARNQYLRLEGSSVVVAPRGP